MQKETISYIKIASAKHALEWGDRVIRSKTKLFAFENILENNDLPNLFLSIRLSILNNCQIFLHKCIKQHLIRHKLP